MIKDFKNIFTICLTLFLLFAITGSITCAEEVRKKKSHSLNNHRKTNQQANSNNIIEFSKPPAGLLKEDLRKKYVHIIERKINKNWKPPKGFKSKKTVVLFKINKNGQLLNSEVIRSSGNIESDRKALEAINTAAPFPPVPHEVDPEGMTIEFGFDYKAAYGTTKKFSIKNNTVKKHPYNPMKHHTYDPAEGHYYHLVLKELKTMRIPSNLYHFNEFPVKVWIQPMSAQRKNLIMSGLKDFAYYFPMVEVSNKRNANLIIRLVNQKTFMRETGRKTLPKSVVACGGRTIIGRHSFGEVLILPHLFNSETAKGSIIHEVGHAFGIAGHSDNKDDRMYPRNSRVVLNQEGVLIRNKVFQTVDEANNLTPRDLNTLWLIYNNW